MIIYIFFSLQRMLFPWLFPTTLHLFTLRLCCPCLLTLHHLHRPRPTRPLHSLPRQNVFHNTVSLALRYHLPQICSKCFPNQRQYFNEGSTISNEKPSSPLLALPPDWFSNPDSLKESFRIASNLDWANIDLSGYPGMFCFV